MQLKKDLQTQHVLINLGDGIHQQRKFAIRKLKHATFAAKCRENKRKKLMYQENRNFDPRPKSEREISDSSKPSFLSEVLNILQTQHFIFQSTYPNVQKFLLH